MAIQPLHIRIVYGITGVVQGVGFRPALYRLAHEAGLTGWVQNRSGTVRLALEGAPEQVAAFMHALPARLPPIARMDSVTEIERYNPAADERLSGFEIVDSPLPTEVHLPVGGATSQPSGTPGATHGERGASRLSLRSRHIAGLQVKGTSDGAEPPTGSDSTEILIPPDLAICADCLAEILDPANRRYGYPFTTCTNCGPRYTLVQAMPYDRERTTMAEFPLCPACRQEYLDPQNRRFHAETIACHDCGPGLSMEDSAGAPIPGNALAGARRELSRGSIVAVRGIGGFLLAADAFNRPTLAALRQRKNRPHKPFAVMAPDLEVLRRYCIVPLAAEQLLASPEAPIVILDVRPEVASADRLPLDLISPDTPTLGAMLPTAPLHKLLFEPLHGDPLPRFELLVMTSGNRRGEPICLTRDEARDRLQGIADVLLTHNREINLRDDDSLCIIQHGKSQVWRRARGYAPNPVQLRQPLARCVLGMGAEIKNTIALGYDRRIVLSPHIGDLDTPEAVDGLKQVADAFPRFLARTPEAVAVDLHPDMHATVLGRVLAGKLGVPVIEVQHHHAHALACLVEHGEDSGLALVFDGTGMGSDGTIWGAELLEVSPDGFRRLASFSGVPLPGGDAAVRQPLRQLVARWVNAGMEVPDKWIVKLGLSPDEVTTWTLQSRRGINTPLTHAAGRVFDAVSVLLGFAPDIVTYEGQAAIRLEAAARRHGGTPGAKVPFHAIERGGMLFIDWREAFVALADMREIAGRDEEWAMAFHVAIAAAALAMVEYGLSHSKARRVALSGGCFMNRILNDCLVPQLEQRGLRVMLHRQTPPNDGCISAGQVVAAGGRA